MPHVAKNIPWLRIGGDDIGGSPAQSCVGGYSIPAELAAVRLDGQATTLKRRDIEDFRAGLRGPLLLPGEAGYDEARVVWNAAFDRRPALIARCAGAADIARALQFGARTNCWSRCAAVGIAPRDNRCAKAD